MKYKCFKELIEVFKKKHPIPPRYLTSKQADKLALKLGPMEGLCFYCGAKLSGRRTRWCSNECVINYQFLIGVTSVIRHEVNARDKGICAKCGVNTISLKKDIMNTAVKEFPSLLEKYKNYFSKSILTLKDLLSRMRSTLWDADHIIPVKDGGGLSLIDNYQTLCISCHKKKTHKKK